MPVLHVPACVGVSLDLVAGMEPDVADSTRGELWLTAVVMEFLERRLGSMRDEWQLLATKASRWMLSVTGTTAVRAAVLAAAAAVVDTLS